MRKFLSKLKRFFLPPEGTPLWQRILPYGVLGFLTLIVLVSSAYAWEYTNSPEFCGVACHTMPPEYTSYLTSPHARIDCVDCHIGEGFITTRITRKAGDVKHIIRLAMKDYEFPITAGEMRPARDTCEKCHFPEKFSDDSLREIKHFGDDTANTPTSIYLIMKTGGGTKRFGLGQGIHWHIENKVLFFSSDDRQQEIPYVRVINDDGTVEEFIDINSQVNVDSIEDGELHEMDCISCHNRITHLVSFPEDIVDQLLANGVVSTDIPDIRFQAVELFYREYETNETALLALQGLENYYESNYPDFYLDNITSINTAIAELQKAYSQSVYINQNSDWESHPNNIGHEFSPGCFRCHDGTHLNDKEEAIRLECNICHSIPVITGVADFVTDIEISRGPEPETHINPNWIGLHRNVFDESCANCHTVEDPGGVSNTSFCSNSACHGTVFEYAGFNAPALREILKSQLPPLESEMEPTPIPVTIDTKVLGFSQIGPLFILRCTSCHGVDGLQGLDLSAYEPSMAGSDSGPVILPGDPQNSLLIKKMTSDQPHFNQFTPQELKLIITWIENGATEQ